MHAIQTVKQKVWQGNDSNRVELVEQFPTTFKLWLAEHRNILLNTLQLFEKWYGIFYYLHCCCCRFHFASILNIKKRFVRLTSGANHSIKFYSSKLQLFVWIFQFFVHLHIHQVSMWKVQLNCVSFSLEIVWVTRNFWIETNFPTKYLACTLHTESYEINWKLFIINFCTKKKMDTSSVFPLILMWNIYTIYNATYNII